LEEMRGRHQNEINGANGSNNDNTNLNDVLQLIHRLLVESDEHKLSHSDKKQEEIKACDVMSTTRRMRKRALKQYLREDTTELLQPYHKMNLRFRSRPIEVLA